MACSENERTRSLIDGTVKPQGFDLTVLPTSISEMFHRMLVNKEFDVCEMSLCSYLVASSAGMDITAIPVFPLRNFRHGYVFCNAESKIESPQDLKGKKVGINVWQNTAAVWVKGYLEHDYDVPLAKVKWISLFDESYRIPLKPPSGVSLTPVKPNSNLEDMLEQGTVDALIWPIMPAPFLRGSKRVKRLFPDYQEVEKDYYRRTKIFPIMHVIVEKRELHGRLPWVATNLMKAFQEAKALYYRRIGDMADRYGYCWSQAWMEKEREVFDGRETYPYNIADNERALTTLIQYAAEQGLTKKKLELKTLFAIDGAA